MLFSELYSAYYNTVAAILSQAVQGPMTEERMREIVAANAFGESGLTIPSALAEERWQLLRKDGTTPICHCPELPLTNLQKRWLKAIALDPRVKLFGDISFDFPEVEPLFRPEDVLLFDKYADGDPYDDPAYQEKFRLILEAVHQKQTLDLEVVSRKGVPSRLTMRVQRLEYSQKDDKFRLVGAGSRFGNTVNLARIVRCKISEEPLRRIRKYRSQSRTVVFELVNQRNALERVLLHFAHFQKKAERLGQERYRVTVYYEKDDETELVIRLLSFGPMVKVTEPESFHVLIKERLLQQKSCGL